MQSPFTRPDPGLVGTNAPVQEPGPRRPEIGDALHFGLSSRIKSCIYATVRMSLRAAWALDTDTFGMQQV